MRNKEIAWAGKMPLDTIEELDTACYATQDGDIRIKYSMEVSLSDLVGGNVDSLNTLAEDSLLGDSFETGLADISYRPISCKQVGETGSFCTGIVTLEVNASVKDIFVFEYPDIRLTFDKNCAMVCVKQ